MPYLSSDLYLILKDFGDLSLLPDLDPPQGQSTLPSGPWASFQSKFTYQVHKFIKSDDENTR
jgi:hypothetical protein